MFPVFHGGSDFGIGLNKMPIFVVIALAAITFNFSVATHNVRWVGREIHCLATIHKKCAPQAQQQQRPVIIFEVPAEDPGDVDPRPSLGLPPQDKL